jgi:heterodisulfide reductase subunit B
MKALKYTIPGYQSNELSSVIMFHKHKLCSKLQTSEDSFVSVCHVCSVSTDNILMWICEV